jgi:hypothetical protein
VKPSSAILRKASSLLQDAADGREVNALEARRLALALAPRPRIRKNVPRHPRPPPPGKMTRSEIYAFCNERAIAAGDKCECGCGRRLSQDGRTLDHWLNGNGRKKQKESVFTCWMLTPWCHKLRQEYIPDAADWNEKFKTFCQRNGGAAKGYVFEPHVEHQRLQARSG